MVASMSSKTAKWMKVGQYLGAMLAVAGAAALLVDHPYRHVPLILGLALFFGGRAGLRAELARQKG